MAGKVRQARKLLGWEPSKLARRAKVHSLIVERARVSLLSRPSRRTRRRSLNRRTCSERPRYSQAGNCGLRAPMAKSIMCRVGASLGRRSIRRQGHSPCQPQARLLTRCADGIVRNRPNLRLSVTSWGFSWALSPQSTTRRDLRLIMPVGLGGSSPRLGLKARHASGR